MADLLVRVGSLGRGTIPGSGIVGTSGVWTNVTPGGISLNPADNGTDNYGVQDVLAHPVTAGVFYAFTCYNGVWKSTDYGQTWVQKHDGTGALAGKCWGSEIAPDGSYMLATIGNNFGGTPEYNFTILKSVDDGVTWTQSTALTNNGYNADIDKADKTHCIAAMHDTNKLWESNDSGATWTDRGAMSTASVSAYVHFIDSTHILCVSQDGAANGNFLGTWGGASWTWAQITSLNGYEHYHGSHQIFIDVPNGAIYSPGGGSGIARSTNSGVTWTGVSTVISGAVVGTGSNLHAQRSFPDNVNGSAVHYQTALRSTGTSWSGDSTPSGMTNGAKRMASGTDGTRWCVVAGCWNGGIWRYIE